MIKKLLIRRIWISLITLIIIGILYYFPTNKINNDTKYVTLNALNDSMVYLMDNNNYVVKIGLDNFEINNNIEDLIKLLTKNSDYSMFLPMGFKALIPEGTILLNYGLESGLLTLNFNEKFLNIDSSNESKMLESLVYTLTELDDINEIMIYINGEKLTKLPNSSRKLPDILDRSIGINNICSITSIKDTSSITIYYLNEYKEQLYYIPVTKVINSSLNKIDIIIEELKSSDNDIPNLSRYLEASAQLSNYNILENEIYLEFNNLIFKQFNEKDITEEARYALSYTIQDSFNIKNVTINY